MTGYWSQFLARLPFWLIFRFFIRLETIGLENIKDLRGPMIIIINHKNYIDGTVLGASLPARHPFYPLRFMAGGPFYRMIIVGFFLKITGNFPVDQGLGYAKNAEIPLDILRRGGTVAVFPEGKMVFSADEFGIGHRGTSYLAYHARVSVLPVVVKGTAGLNPLRFIFRRRKIKIIFGRPFEFWKELRGDDNPELERGGEIMMAKIKELYYR